MAFETRSLLRNDGNHTSKNGMNDRASSSSDDWSSSYSSASPDSHRSSDEDYACEWESHVARDGTLFYLEYNIQPTAVNNAMNADKGQTLLALRNDLKRSSLRRSKKAGIRLSNLINGNQKIRKDEKKKKTNKSHANKNEQASGGDTTNKVKFNELAEGELKEVTIFIDPTMRHKFGRRTTLAEALLGISLCPFPNSNRIMIAGYMPNSEISQEKVVKIGDWLKSINEQELNAENVELILLSFTQPTYIKLQLKRIAVEEPPPHDLNVGKATCTSEYVDTLKSLFAASKSDDCDSLVVFNVLIITLKEKPEYNWNAEDVIFCYPPRGSNRLYSLRGIFLTMNSLFRECTFNSRPKISRVTIQNVEYFVAYHSTFDELLLISIPTTRMSLQDAKLKLNTIVRNFQLCFRHLSSAVLASMPTTQDISNDSNQSELHRNFAIDDTCSIITFVFTRANPLHSRFQDILLHPHYIPLPKEGQLRIDDTLSEMEAMDYREWNDEPLKSHREFYIIGSALYFRKYLLASHLSKSDLLDVEAFLRVHGIYMLIENKPVSELIIWRQIYPKSVTGGFFEDEISQNLNRSLSSQWFLTIVAKNQLFLAVILESRHSIDNNEASSLAANNHTGPSRFYIDEIQDTLDHLQTGGVENLATTWLNANKRPEVVLFKEDQCQAIPLSSQSNHHAALNASGATSSSANTVEAIAMGLKNIEVISILKRRNNSNENVNDNVKFSASIVAQTAGGSPSLNSQTYSDGSLQKFDDDDDESDSDWDGFPESQRSSSGFDMSEMNSTFLREITDVLSSKITAGKENVLYGFVQIEMGDGILLAPPNLQPINSMNVAFQRSALLIHSILQNSLRFRHLLSHETSTTNIHRSLVAIKEHGMLISLENGGIPSFWVIGRLFANPTKELYICHRGDIPQNLVEMAFRLALHSAG